MQRREFLSSTVGLALLATCFSGCGKGAKSKYGVVKFGGRATYDGKPIPEKFTLLFTPAEGKQSGSEIGADGAFYAKYSSAEDGVQKGALKVTVGWDDEVNGDVPAEFKEFFDTYSTRENALEINVEKADVKYALEFPKK